MTNHPRRLGRRKHQRQFDRGLTRVAKAAGSTIDAWTDLTHAIQSVRLAGGREMVPGRVLFGRTGRAG